MIECDIALLADMVALLAITGGRSEARAVVDMIVGGLAGALLAFCVAKEASDSTAVRLVALVALGGMVGGIFGLVFGSPRRLRRLH